jgi:hypothetical protein
MFARWYERLGPRYPMAALAAALRFEHVIVIVGVGALALYVPVSVGEAALLVAAAIATQELYAQLTERHFRQAFEPLCAWIEHRRGGDEAVAAWQVAASMPYKLLQVWWRGGYPIIAGLIWCVFAIWLLSLPAWNVPVLFLVAELRRVIRPGGNCASSST